jgi:hypothetical protein
MFIKHIVPARYWTEPFLCSYLTSSVLYGVVLQTYSHFTNEKSERREDNSLPRTQEEARFEDRQSPGPVPWSPFILPTIYTIHFPTSNLSCEELEVSDLEKRKLSGCQECDLISDGFQWKQDRSRHLSGPLGRPRNVGGN